MDFSVLKKRIKQESKTSFQEASAKLEEMIFALNCDDFIPLLNNIGTIPEDIGHDSTEEKLYAKVSDIVLAKCFQELGLEARVLRERANCADVYVESPLHKYKLFADAKAFRFSRTAKNQKDFKVESMTHWKKNADYAVLSCPYFQYPRKESQVYASAIKGNVCCFRGNIFL